MRPANMPGAFWPANGLLTVLMLRLWIRAGISWVAPWAMLAAALNFAISIIRVNAMAPGFIDTDLMRKVGMSEEMIEGMNDRARTQIPMGRIGTSDDIAKTVLFLASEDSAYVSGIELSVDGGSGQI